MARRPELRPGSLSATGARKEFGYHVFAAACGASSERPEVSLTAGGEAAGESAIS